MTTAKKDDVSGVEVSEPEIGLGAGRRDNNLVDVDPAKHQKGAKTSDNQKRRPYPAMKNL